MYVLPLLQPSRYRGESFKKDISCLNQNLLCRYTKLPSQHSMLGPHYGMPAKCHLNVVLRAAQ